MVCSRIAHLWRVRKRRSSGIPLAEQGENNAHIRVFNPDSEVHESRQVQGSLAFGEKQDEVLSLQF